MIARIESFKFDYYYFDPKRHELIEVQNNNAYVYLFTDGWYFYDVNGNKHKYNRLQISDACERLCNKEELIGTPPTLDSISSHLVPEKPCRQRRM